MENMEKIQEEADKLKLSLKDIAIINHLKDENYEKYVEQLFQERQRKGMTKNKAQDMLKSRRYYSLMMLKHGVVDGYLGGVTRAYADTALPVLQLIGLN